MYPQTQSPVSAHSKEQGESLTQMNTPAFAKLNLFLLVTGRTDNGYHTLQSLFTLIDLHDDLGFTLRQDGLIRRCTDIPGLPEADDLVVRAARLLKEYTQTPFGVDIELVKRIPSGAGLGGGSSDAASTLLSLNQLWQTQLSSQELARLGLQLGADVPFFLFGQTAMATGVGENLVAFDLAPVYYVILRPALFIATPSIFKDPDLVRNSPVLSDSELLQGRKELEQAKHFARNDLEAVALKQFTDLLALIAGLRSAGFDLRMTGSGSCFFAPYLTREQAEKAKQAIELWLEQHQPSLAVEQVLVVKGLNQRL